MQDTETTRKKSPAKTFIFQRTSCWWLTDLSIVRSELGLKFGKVPRAKKRPFGQTGAGSSGVWGKRLLLAEFGEFVVFRTFRHGFVLQFLLPRTASLSCASIGRRFQLTQAFIGTMMNMKTIRHAPTLFSPTET